MSESITKQTNILEQKRTQKPTTKQVGYAAGELLNKCFSLESAETRMRTKISN